MPPQVAVRWSEVVRGFGLCGASPTEWDVQTMHGGTLVRKGWGGIAQGSVLLLAQRGVGYQKESQLLLVRVMLLLQPSFQLHQALFH